MEIPITTIQLRSIVREAAELGAIIALTRVGKLPPYLNKRQAYRRYGKKNIEQWLEEGQLTMRNDGGRTTNWRIDRIEIEAIVRGLELWRQL